MTPRLSDKPTKCSIDGCLKEIHAKGLCKEHHRDRVCPTGEGEHVPLPWSIWNCQNGMRMGKCGLCKKAYIIREPGNYPRES